MIFHFKNNPMGTVAGALRRAPSAVGRHAGEWLGQTLQRAYAAHTEKVQMRLAPLRLRSWSEIPHAGTHHNCS